ncbi:MAG: GNAT family N-acetyltransferase [Methylococcales bacterium]|nr:GNAT family N-acetyltransferase [Methylococcales bacterium]
MLKVSTVAHKKTLEGRRILLEAVKPDHAEFLARTYKLDDFMDCYRLAQDRSLNVEDIRTRLENEKDISPQQLKCIEWVIKLRSNSGKEEAIGIASLADYQVAHNRAELLVGINDPKYRNSGLGIEATLLILEYAFQQISLHKVVIFVYSFNQIAQDTSLHLGFQQEGFLRDHYFNHRDGHFIGLYQSSFLASDFYKNIKVSRWSKRLLGRDITLKKLQPEISVMTEDEITHDFESFFSYCDDSE